MSTDVCFKICLSKEKGVQIRLGGIELVKGGRHGRIGG